MAVWPFWLRGVGREPYNFWQDFLGTFRSSDVIKALWLVVPPAFVVAQTWVMFNATRLQWKKAVVASSQQKSRID